MLVFVSVYTCDFHCVIPIYICIYIYACGNVIQHDTKQYTNLPFSSNKYQHNAMYRRRWYNVQCVKRTVCAEQKFVL